MTDPESDPHLPPPSKEMPLAAMSSRREIISIAVGVIGALFGGINAAPKIKEWWEAWGNQVPPSTREAAINFLFRNSENHFYAASKDNPYRGIRGITPATADALSSTLGILGFNRERMRAIDTLCTHKMDGSAIFFGGPVANVHSRQILGIGKGSPLLSKSEGRPIMLPIHFGNVLVENPKAHDRPPYQLIFGESTRDLNNDEDYLLLTSIPNIFSPWYKKFGDHRIVCSAGLHGPGSRGIKLLLERPRLLDEIQKQAAGLAGWQVLFRVRPGSDDWPSDLAEQTKVQEIKVDFDRAREMVQGKCYWIDRDDPLLKV